MSETRRFFRLKGDGAGGEDTSDILMLVCFELWTESKLSTSHGEGNSEFPIALV